MNFGIVLAGGLAKGAYQIGALKAIQEKICIEDIKAISCASVGCLNGFSFATGNLEYAEEVWRNMCENNKRILFTKIIKSGYLKQSMKFICCKKDRVDRNLYFSLMELRKKSVIYPNLYYIEPCDYLKYVNASIAMPLYDPPVRIKEDTLFDGGLVDNIPVYPLLKCSLDYIFCIYFDDSCYTFENTIFDSKIIKIVFPERSIFFFEKQCISEMIDEGYETAKNYLDFILKNGIEDTEHINNTVAFLNKKQINRTIRITADILLSSSNKIADLFTRRIIKN